jgi:hypothetical protein
MPANRIRLTCDFHRALPIIPAFVDRRCALATVDASFQGNSLKFLKEMAVWTAVPVYKNPPSMGRVLPALLQKEREACWNGNGPLFVVFRSKANVLFLAYVKLHPFEVNVGPGSELHLLFAAGGSKEELIPDSILLGHDREQLFQLLLCERNGRVLLERWEIVGQRKTGLNPMFFEERENCDYTIVQGPRFIPAGCKVVAKFSQSLLGDFIEKLQGFGGVKELREVELVSDDGFRSLLLGSFGKKFFNGSLQRGAIRVGGLLKFSYSQTFGLGRERGVEVIRLIASFCECFG